MIVCGNCGAKNEESDAFCGNCGTFLEWVGKREEAAAAAAAAEAQRKADEEAAAAAAAEAQRKADEEAAAAAKTPPPRRGGPSRTAAVPIAAVIAADAEPDAAASSVASAATPSTLPVTPPTPGAAGPQPPAVQPVSRPPSTHPSTQPTGAAPGSAASTATQPPARPPTATPDQPEARKPTAIRPVETRPPVSTTVERRVAQPGDRICGVCSEANDPARKFCRRCGEGLLEARIVAAPAPRVPWWRRIFRRQEKQYAAGERKASMKAGTGARGSGMGRIRIRQAIEWGLGLLVVLGIVGYIAVPSMQQVVNRAASTGITTVQRMLNPRLEPVRPTEFEASGQLDEHGIEKLFDKYANTDWRASGGQPTVMVRFAEPFDLGALIVYAGASQQFTETRRPAKLELTFPDGSATVIDLKDDNVKQEITVDKSGIDGFELKVLESYGPPDAPVTISEIEVFARR